VQGPALVQKTAVLLAAIVSTALPARAADPVSIGVLGASSDAPYYIADAKGYFRDAGIVVNFVNATNTAQLVAPLGTGELDVGSGAPSASLYNAVARGINIKIVADKGSMPPGYGFMPLLVRKDLIDSGRFKSFADLKGLKVGSPTPGGANVSTLVRALDKGGLRLKDIDPVFLGQIELALALENKALDAALVTEPNATLAVNDGKAVRFAGGDEIRRRRETSCSPISAPRATTTTRCRTGISPGPARRRSSTSWCATPRSRTPRSIATWCPTASIPTAA